MAIVKMTFRYTNRITAVPPEEGKRKIYGELAPDVAANVIQSDAAHIGKVAAIMSYLNQYPKEGITKAIRLHYAGQIDCNIKTKKTRVYSIACLWIHEQD